MFGDFSDESWVPFGRLIEPSTILGDPAEGDPVVDHQGEKQRVSARGQLQGFDERALGRSREAARQEAFDRRRPEGPEHEASGAAASSAFARRDYFRRQRLIARGSGRSPAAT